ncbi:MULTISPECIES: SWIM zinc finger family protein [unclassified Streptomyces]|uniref:SWIM zinc finger family protein n=1 Tax=unclassified Streptomyces TaxID=2593676 RepID=UPI0009A11B51|nr:SWIM zinc finger family protein [Streptomyces sp. TSRI0107]
MSEVSRERDAEGAGADEAVVAGTGIEGDGAEETRSARPGDAARRALRAARGTRGAAAGTPTTDAVGGVEDTGTGDTGDADGTREFRAPRASREPREPRPGDAARAALRRAVAARRGAGEHLGEQAEGEERAVGEVPQADDRSAGAEPHHETHAEPHHEAHAEPHHKSDDEPGDEPHHTPAGAPRTGDSRDTRPADAARDALRAARREQEKERAATKAPRTAPVRRPDRPTSSRDVAAFLANAFRMPADTDGPAEPSHAAAPSHAVGPARPATPSDANPRPHRATWAADADAEAAARPEPGSTPRSMASPRRDGDLRRTFPAFPPRPSEGDGRFAETWWGDAWITALEEGALDAKRLDRGRGYAERGHVDAITVTPGLVLAYVHGSRPRPYRVQIRLRTLDDADWERFLDAAADRPGHIAALLDKEMPHSLAEGDVPLLPGPGDLEPRCSCPDRGHPCKHAAALCYQTARLLDADPFVLLLLRGRGERELLDALSRLSATRAARSAQDRDPAPLPGVRAADALAPRRLPPLPAPLPVPPHPEQPPAYPAAPGGPDPLALDQLATDAAARAHALLATGHDPAAELTLWQDAVRLAAARPGAGLTVATRGLYASLASAAGRTPAELARAVAAWRQGGPDGLAALEEPWDPPAGRFDRARPLLLAADLPAFRPWRNRLTHPRGHLQLRLGRDGLWYGYESDPGADDWWPRGTPDPDPVGALTGLGASAEA